MSTKKVCDICDSPQSDTCGVGNGWLITTDPKKKIKLNLYFTQKKEERIDVCKECLFNTLVELTTKLKAQHVVDRL